MRMPLLRCPLYKHVNRDPHKLNAMFINSTVAEPRSKNNVQYDNDKTWTLYYCIGTGIL